jgi:hypothetical protein
MSPAGLSPIIKYFEISTPDFKACASTTLFAYSKVGRDGLPNYVTSTSIPCACCIKALSARINGYWPDVLLNLNVDANTKSGFVMYSFTNYLSPGPLLYIIDPFLDSNRSEMMARLSSK